MFLEGEVGDRAGAWIVEQGWIKMSLCPSLISHLITSTLENEIRKLWNNEANK